MLIRIVLLVRVRQLRKSKKFCSPCKITLGPVSLKITWNKLVQNRTEKEIKERKCGICKQA